MDGYRFDIWRQKCVHREHCAEDMEYDEHAERCVPFRNWCDQMSAEKFNLYGKCVSSCDDWKQGNEEYAG